MLMRSLFLPAIAVILFSSDSLSQVVETSKGKIEFVGLEGWHLATIQQKLDYESPDRLFFVQHDLTGRLGFADAACVIYLEHGKPYKFLTVIEPGRAREIQYLPSPPRSLPAPDEWRELIRVVEEGKFVNALVNYGGTLRAALKTEKPLIPEEEKTWFVHLQRRRGKKDYELALGRLAEDGDYRNRVTAAMVLANFADREQAWRSLMVGLRDSNQWVRTACSQVLVTLTKYIPRPISVDWLPVAGSINHLLKGTNVHTLQNVLKILLKTQVSSRAAKPLLRDGGGRLLLSYIRAAHQEERDLARQLLVRLSGNDFGLDDRRWARWIDSL